MTLPTWVHRRETILCDGEVVVEMTYDEAEADSWVDSLLDDLDRDVIEAVAIYGSPLNWGHDMAPQAERVLRRHRGDVETSVDAP